jgi:hypothetical protein
VWDFLFTLGVLSLIAVLLKHGHDKLRSRLQ